MNRVGPMLPLSPRNGGTKRDFAVFASKIQLLSKKVCYKVSCAQSDPPLQKTPISTDFAG